MYYYTHYRSYTGFGGLSRLPIFSLIPLLHPPPLTVLGSHVIADPSYNMTYNNSAIQSTRGNSNVITNFKGTRKKFGTSEARYIEVRHNISSA